jgi:hypothetical protein
MLIRIKMSELQFKRWFVAAWGGWLVRIEPRMGGDVGVSDVMVPIDGILVPVELKLLVDGRVSEIRPSQKVWHRQAAEVGLATMLAAGEKTVGKGWKAHLWLWGRVGEGVVVEEAGRLRSTVEEMVRGR